MQTESSEAHLKRTKNLYINRTDQTKQVDIVITKEGYNFRSEKPGLPKRLGRFNNKILCQVEHRGRQKKSVFLPNPLPVSSKRPGNFLKMQAGLN